VPPAFEGKGKIPRKTVKGFFRLTVRKKKEKKKNGQVNGKKKKGRVQAESPALPAKG